MLTHEEIVNILNREVYFASENLAQARRNVDTIIAEGAGMLPQPDGMHRVAKASREHAQARDALELALRRHCEFTFRGVVPEDLK